MTASTRLLPGQRSHVERGGDGVRDQPRIGQLGELDERGARLIRRLGASGELEREPRLAGAARTAEREEPRLPQAASCSSASSRSRPTNELVFAGSPNADRWTERGELLLELDDERRELLAPRLRPVVVPVLRQELAAVQRERGAVGRRRLDQACIGRRKLEPIDVDRLPRGRAPRFAIRSPPGRARVARRALPGGGCWQRPRDRGRARARPSPARGAADGPARARAASQARAPSSAARRSPEPSRRRPQPRSRREA